MRFSAFVAAVTLFAITFAGGPAAAQSEQPTVTLVVGAGRPMRVALDERIALKRVGQPVTGTVIEPVYACDRIVIPVGAHVRGHVAQIDAGSRLIRARAYLGGNFSPPKHAVLAFDTLLLDAGRGLPIDTVVTGGIPNVKRQVAGASVPARKGDAVADDVAADRTLAMRARSEVRQRTSDAVASARQQVSATFASIKSFRQPGQMRRLKDAAIQQLPYHPQYLAQGTVYDAELSSPLSFGAAVAAERAPAGTAPAPDSILMARLATTLDSSRTPRGTPFQAVITETVFSGDHRVILPEGTTLTGEVTLAAPARRFHRNGRLRFLFESVQLPGQPPMPLLGALHAVDASDDDHVTVDDEGGTTLSNSKSRFIAPTLALLTLRSSMEHDGRRFADPDGDGTIKTAGAGAGSRGVGGFIGLGLVGAAFGQITRPIGIGLSVYGAARTLYTNVLGKGREVIFPANTPIQVQLAPGPTAR